MMYSSISDASIKVTTGKIYVKFKRNCESKQVEKQKNNSCIFQNHTV